MLQQQNEVVRSRIVPSPIEAVAIAYLNNKKSFKTDEEADLKKILMILKSYIQNIDPKSPAYQLLSNFK